MIAKVQSYALCGVSAQPVTVECDVSGGFPSFDTVGLPELSVREARVRVRSAIRHADLPFPKTRVIVSLAPADLRKEGTHYDLPIALAVLAASGEIPAGCLEGVAVVGELSLTGAVRTAPGVAAVVEQALLTGACSIVVPAGNANEAAAALYALAPGFTDPKPAIMIAQDLQQVVHCLKGEAWPFASAQAPAPSPHAALDWQDVRGVAKVKRALEIAAAGGHNVVMVGSPGTGKTMLARRIPTILPDLTPAEAHEVTKIHSVAGLLGNGDAQIARRPFRAPHHTCSAAALIGGGSVPKPGEASLAHRGVLFLDEFAEFPRQIAECLRQPLADGEVAVTRAGATTRFPAAFQLICALNPCPCGHGAGNPRCNCSGVQLERYGQRLSQPVLDHCDIVIRVDAPRPADLRAAEIGDSSATVKARVTAARARQIARQGSLNAQTTPIHFAKIDPLAPKAQKALTEGAPGADRGTVNAVWRVARTIADLAGAKEIGAEHVLEALELAGKPIFG